MTEFNRQRFQIFDFAPIGYFVIDESYRVLFWNKVMESWTSISEAEILHDDLFERFPHLKDRKYFSRIESIFRGGPPVVFSSQIHKYTIPALLPDGSFRFQQTSITKVIADESVSEGDRIHYAIFSIQDETGLTSALSKNRQTLKKINEEVKERIRFEGELKTSNQELERARQEALKANEAKSTFLAKMSHELRTPLNAILGISYLLKDSNEQEQEGFINEIQLATKHLTSLIGDILDFSKIEAEHFDLNQEPFDLYDIKETIDTLKIQAKLKGLVLKLTIEDGLLRYYVGDLLRIKQIIYNLVGNSLKFTKKGIIRVGIEGLEEDIDGLNKIEIRVIDTGPGIAQDKIKTIFQPFVQSDAKSTTPGTGLGLTISHEFAVLMGGDIRIESTLGEGTSFIVTLLLKPDTKDSAIDKTVMVIDESQPLKNKSALVVDDVAINRTIIKMMLEKYGWYIEQADSGESAIELLSRKHDFDIIFMDISMEGMSGVETTQTLHLLSGVCDIPVVALTAHVIAGDKERFLEAGMSGYVAKPVQPDLLWAEINRLLNSTTRLFSPENDHLISALGDSENVFPVVDFEMMLSRLGDEELCVQILENFIAEKDVYYDELELSVLARDDKKVRASVHKLSGIASNVCAEEVLALGKQVGELAKVERWSAVPETMANLKIAFTKLQPWFDNRNKHLNS